MDVISYTAFWVGACFVMGSRSAWMNRSCAHNGGHLIECLHLMHSGGLENVSNHAYILETLWIRPSPSAIFAKWFSGQTNATGSCSSCCDAHPTQMMLTNALEQTLICATYINNATKTNESVWAEERIVSILPWIWGGIRISQFSFTELDGPKCIMSALMSPLNGKLSWANFLWTPIF